MTDFPNIGKAAFSALALAALSTAAERNGAGIEMTPRFPMAGSLVVEAGYWRSGPSDMRPVWEKPEAEWRTEERAARDRLQNMVWQAWAPDRIEFEDGSESLGWILAQTAEAIVYEERYGDSGRMTVSIPRNRVRAVAKADPPPPLTYRDVEFHMQFPELHFYKVPPYTVVTDESFHEVRRAVDELQRLYREVLQRFGPLIPATARRQDIQALFFSDRAKFNAYRALFAPDTYDLAGFYNPWLDRLVWFNQRDAEAVEQARAWLRAEERRNREQYAGRPDVQFHIDEWKREMDRRIEAFAREMTVRILRHEGAHQLFFSLGVHSKRFVENDWLCEGLAAYAETRPVGARNPERVAVVKAAMGSARWIPLGELLRSKDRRGLSAFGHVSRIELAYGQAWALVSYLMEEKRRQTFFNYLDFIRRDENTAEVERTDSAELLCRFLNMSLTDLEANWIRWLEGI